MTKKLKDTVRNFKKLLEDSYALSPDMLPAAPPKKGKAALRGGFFDLSFDSYPQAGSLKKLEAEITGCTLCRLADERKSIVFGSGSAKSGLMIIGEGPGRDEDIQGLPFVGPAGQLLQGVLLLL